ncbi:RNA-binding domain-containing protein [Eubacteriales bacterium KG125]
MQLLDIKRMAHNILENQNIESSFIEYKKSANFKDKILKTACAFANNYMNNEIGLLFVGIEEVDDKETGEKAIPKRPIEGIKEAKLEGIENELKSLLANIHPKINYHIITDQIDDEYYIVVAVESGSNGPFQTSERAEKDKDIRLKAGRYIRVGRDSRLPNPTEEFELLKKFANFSFSSNLNDTATIDDLSYEYMKEYLLQTGAKKDIREMSKLDMAKSMGLVSESEYGGYRAKNFAVLMFAETPNKFIPNAHVEIIREIDGTDKMESKKFDGPVWIQAKQVSKYFEDNIMASYTIREADKIEHKIVYNYPLTAFKYYEIDMKGHMTMHKLYLDPFMDMCNGEIISFGIARQPSAKNIMDALEQAIAITSDCPYRRTFHSDQGWAYQMKAYSRRLNEERIFQSMSRKGNCHDNSVMENFFGLLKQEIYHGVVYYSYEELKSEIERYIKYYNEQRIKEKLGWMSPVQYRLSLLAA